MVRAGRARDRFALAQARQQLAFDALGQPARAQAVGLDRDQQERQHAGCQEPPGLEKARRDVAGQGGDGTGYAALVDGHHSKVAESVLVQLSGLIQPTCSRQAPGFMPLHSRNAWVNALCS